jgi:hypothetical protein
MAGWDKIRAAAQRPDCIFSAFPDGEAGAMYHPRTSADEYLKLTNIKCESGEFVSHTAASNVINSGGVILAGKSFNATFIVKFYLDFYEDATAVYYAALLAGGGTGGNFSGMGVQAQSVSNGQITILGALRYDIEVDGTITSYRQYGKDFKVPIKKWITLAIAVDFEKKTHTVFYDGAKYGTYTLPAGNLSFSAYQSLATATPLAFELRNPAKGKIKGKYAMIFNRAMSDEEILYLMEE